MLGWVVTSSAWSAAPTLCSTREPEPCIERQQLSANAIQVITHGQEGDGFWAQGIRPAMLQAASDLQVPLIFDLFSCDLTSDQIFEEMSRQIRTAAGLSPGNGRPRALIVTIPAAVEDATAVAVASGIPVIGFNAGAGSAERLGLRAFFGQDEFRGEQTV
eukprot:7380784-Prymnesium_polylepis.10